MPPRELDVPETQRIDKALATQAGFTPRVPDNLGGHSGACGLGKLSFRANSTAPKAALVKAAYAPQASSTFAAPARVASGRGKTRTNRRTRPSPAGRHHAAEHQMQDAGRAESRALGGHHCPTRLRKVRARTAPRILLRRRVALPSTVPSSADVRGPRQKPDVSVSLLRRSRMHVCRGQ